MAIRAAGCANWHPRRATSLEKVVLNACVKGGSREDLVEYMLKHHDRAVIAALARLVDIEARAGDAIAISILTEAAENLAETLSDAMQSLDVTDSDFPLVGAGSVIAGSDVYWQALQNAAGPQFKPFRVTLPPVIGEALVLLARANGGPLAEVRARLIETAEKARP
jgi:N-acetylglucosamine kinase-like BadF-type ATPase